MDTFALVKDNGELVAGILGERPLMEAIKQRLDQPVQLWRGLPGCACPNPAPSHWTAEGGLQWCNLCWHPVI